MVTLSPLGCRLILYGTVGLLVVILLLYLTTMVLDLDSRGVTIAAGVLLAGWAVVATFGIAPLL